MLPYPAIDDGAHKRLSLVGEGAQGAGVNALEVKITPEAVGVCEDVRLALSLFGTGGSTSTA